MSAVSIRAMNFRLNEALREFCEQNLLQAVRGFNNLDKRRQRLIVRVQRENHGLQRGPDEFVCRIETLNKKTRVEMRHASAYGAIELAADMLRRRMSKQTKWFRNRKRYFLRRLTSDTMSEET